MCEKWKTECKIKQFRKTGAKKACHDVSMLENKISDNRHIWNLDIMSIDIMSIDTHQSSWTWQYWYP